MRLTSFTDYTLRTLIYLAAKPQGTATIAEIARAYRISEAHLTKVVHQLGVAGEIETVRGRGGGLRLTRRPSEINLGAVVRRTEADLALVPCFEDEGACAIGGACGLQRVLRRAMSAFLEVLDAHTLADLTGSRRSLAPLLGLG